MNRHGRALALATMLLVGCENPFLPPNGSEESAHAVVELANGEFPPVPASAEVYVRLAPHTTDGHASRYVLYDDGSFELQYVTERRGYFAYSGVRSWAAELVTFDFDAWNAAGPWQAVGTLQEGRLDIDYNIVMFLAGFEDGAYVLRSTE